jgi:hypothetical protein
VDRSPAKDAADNRGSSDVAVADLPSDSGAHWANRDNDPLYRRRDGSTDARSEAQAESRPFRRPPAVNSFPGDDDEYGRVSPGVYLPEPSPELSGLSTDTGDSGWFSGEYDVSDKRRAATAANQPAPEFGPAPPASPGRASFGISAGPIGGAGRGSGRSAAAPTSPASAPVSPAHSRGAMPSAAPISPAHTFAAHVRDAAASAHVRDAGGAAAANSRDAAGATEPGIGEFMSGPGREIRPHRAARHPLPAVEQVSPRSPSSEPPRRSRLLTVATVALSTVVLLGAAVAGVSFFAGSDRSLTSVLKLGASETKSRTVTGPLGGRKAATFELVAATTKVTVRTQDLGDELYKITSAEDSGTKPSPALTKDKLQLRLTPDGDATGGNVEVLLSTKVKWALRFVGGADEQIVDLTGGKVSSIDVLGGSRRLELALPTPAGTIPIRLTGSVDELSVRSPADSPVRVQVGSGAKTVAAGERTLRDVKPGSTLTPKDWKVPNRYDVDVASRITLLSVEAAK